MSGLGREKRKTFLPERSRFTPSEKFLKGVGSRPTTAYGMLDSSPSGYKRSTLYAGSAKNGKATPLESPSNRQSRNFGEDSTCPFPLHNVVPQPPPDYEPFNFPLAHTIVWSQRIQNWWKV